MIRALTLLALLAVPAAAYETAASSCDLQYRLLECGFNGDACPSTCSTSSTGECTLPTADLAKWTADYAASWLTATSVMLECAAITTASSCTGNCAMGTSDAGVATCYATYAKISSLMTADGAPAALVEGYWQNQISDQWFLCSALTTETTCNANTACNWSGSSCGSSTAMTIVRYQNACPSSDYASLVTSVSGGTLTLSGMYATVAESDSSITPAEGVSLSGARGIARSALALAASAAVFAALA